MNQDDSTPLEKALSQEEDNHTRDSTPMLESQEESILVFSLASQYFGIPSEQIREITPVKEVHFLPLMPSYILGVLPWNSEVSPVLNLNEVLGLEPNQPSDRPRLIFAQVGKLAAAIPSEWVVDVLDIPTLEIQHIQEMEDPSLSFLDRYTNQMSQIISILNLEKIFKFCSQTSI